MHASSRIRDPGLSFSEKLWYTIPLPKDTPHTRRKREPPMREFSAGQYDIAVIGAGHAGIEAALAAARMGKRTICFTINLDAVGNMPCNPAIGGTGWVIRSFHGSVTSSGPD